LKFITSRFYCIMCRDEIMHGCLNSDKFQSFLYSTIIKVSSTQILSGYEQLLCWLHELITVTSVQNDFQNSCTQRLPKPPLIISWPIINILCIQLISYWQFLTHKAIIKAFFTQRLSAPSLLSSWAIIDVPWRSSQFLNYEQCLMHKRIIKPFCAQRLSNLSTSFRRNLLTLPIPSSRATDSASCTKQLSKLSTSSSQFLSNYQLHL